MKPVKQRRISHSDRLNAHLGIKLYQRWTLTFAVFFALNTLGLILFWSYNGEKPSDPGPMNHVHIPDDGYSAAERYVQLLDRVSRTFHQKGSVVVVAATELEIDRMNEQGLLPPNVRFEKLSDATTMVDRDGVPPGFQRFLWAYRAESPDAAMYLTSKINHSSILEMSASAPSPLVAFGSFSQEIEKSRITSGKINPVIFQKFAREWVFKHYGKGSDVVKVIAGNFPEHCYVRVEGNGSRLVTGSSQHYEIVDLSFEWSAVEDPKLVRISVTTEGECSPMAGKTRPPRDRFREIERELRDAFSRAMTTKLLHEE